MKDIVKWLTAPALAPVLVRLILVLAAAAGLEAEPLIALCGAVVTEGAAAFRR